MRSTITSRTSPGLLENPEKVKDIIRIEFRAYQFGLVILDLVLTFLAFRAAYLIRFQSGIPIFYESIVPHVSFYSDFMILTIPLWVAIFGVTGLYSTHNLLGGTREYSLLFNATTLSMFLIISAGFLFPDDLILARGWVILAWLLAFLFIAIGRFLARRIVYALRRQGHFQKPALVIGANEEGKLLVEQFANWETASVRLIGYVNGHHSDRIDPKLKYLGGLQDLDHIIDKYGITDLILTSSALTQEEVLGLFRKYGTSKDINLRMSSGLYEIITTGMEVREEGLVPLLTINKVRLTGADQVVKLLMDYLIAIPAVIILMPLFALVALAIKLDSPGPVIYRRRVMGVNGKQFDAFKFRTMKVDGDEILASNPELMQEYLENFKLKNDPRVTRVGKLIRKTSVDELPQLFNVLLNQMSLVGPRMICPPELTKYDQWDINLLTVKPGITGLWQVRGRSDISYEERVRLDMFYIRNWTIWLDIQLLVQTPTAVLSHRGAY